MPIAPKDNVELDEDSPSNSINEIHSKNTDVTHNDDHDSQNSGSPKNGKFEMQQFTPEVAQEFTPEKPRESTTVYESPNSKEPKAEELSEEVQID